MDFGVCVATKIDDIGYIRFAENLGYSHAWIADSQMIWSDCYAVLALAAQQTEKIQLGTGVSVAGTRAAPVTAHSIATINRLAPGRTFLGLGTGNTAMRLMGHRPMRLGEFSDEVRAIRGMLRGETVEYPWRGEKTLVEFQMPGLGFIDIEHEIPIYVSGFGPKTQALAGELGDGIVLSIPPDAGQMHRAMANVEKGAARAGRRIDPSKYLSCSLTMAAILEPGETLASERVRGEVGPFALSSLHYVYDRVRQMGGHPPPRLSGIWEKYVELVEAVPLERRHFRIHAGHCTYVLPEEQELLTPELIEATCLVGTPEEIVTQVRDLEATGLQQIMLLPSLNSQYPFLQRFSEQVMAAL
jgi:5,10-methylenetetrahydromethanopterin reductase